MKLYAQHGHADGQKTARGFELGLIDGVIYSPKDIALPKLKDSLADIAEQQPQADRFFDPQVYASFVATQADSRTGCLLEDYAQPHGYFAARRRSQFDLEDRIKDQLRRCISFQQGLSLSGIIAPNIHIPESCNSLEAAIAKNFIRYTKPIADELGVRLPVFATLCLSRDALVNMADYIDFLSDITVLDSPPDGFYLLVSASKPDARLEIFNSEVIAGWMLLNRTLSENGMRVINGYSDLLTPFLGLAGGEAGASGWWSNLRTFSLDRFGPPVQGGSLPTVRYLSRALLGRVTSYELEIMRTLLPGVMNRLPTDAMYPLNDEPARVDEVLQTWDTLRDLNRSIAESGIVTGLAHARTAVQAARDFRQQLQHLPVRLENKSDGSHLEPLLRGLARFAELAELT